MLFEEKLPVSTKNKGPLSFAAWIRVSNCWLVSYSPVYSKTFVHLPGSVNLDPPTFFKAVSKSFSIVLSSSSLGRNSDGTICTLSA